MRRDYNTPPSRQFFFGGRFRGKVAEGGQRSALHSAFPPRQSAFFAFGASWEMAGYPCDSGMSARGINVARRKIGRRQQFKTREAQNEVALPVFIR